MKVHIRAHGVELTDDLHALVLRRVLYGLSRFAQSIQDVHVTLEDVNGPRGGDDKVCRLRVRAGRKVLALVEHRAGTCEAAVTASVARGARVVARELTLAHTTRP